MLLERNAALITSLSDMSETSSTEPNEEGFPQSPFVNLMVLVVAVSGHHAT